ncbi:conserved hypothetical protein [Ricinus communis]|uniref:Uncharacterized protein n=1 Tax=Ricinus communis TaxID=3988 RepID=B9THG9_RICCO|nr:conserved hypothetical protein [Ricinus communis]
MAQARGRDADGAQQRRHADVPAAHAATSSVAAPQEQRDSGRQVGNGGDQALLEHVEFGAELGFEAADDGGQEEGQRIQPVDQPEVDQRQHPHAAVLKRAGGMRNVGGPLAALLGLQRRSEPFALGFVEPLGLGRPVGQVEPGDHADHDGRQRDAGEHHAPAFQAEQAVRLDQQRRHRRADDDGQRLRQVEQRQDMAAVLGRHPQAQVQDGAGEEAGLGHAQQEAQHIQPFHAADPGEQQRDDAPGDHDARQPAARAVFVQGQVAGDFQQHIADEEHAGGEAELGGGQRQVLGHAVGAGERDRGAIQEVDEEHQPDERHEPHRDLADGRFLDRAGGGLHIVSWLVARPLPFGGGPACHVVRQDQRGAANACARLAAVSCRFYLVIAVTAALCAVVAGCAPFPDKRRFFATGIITIPV